MAIKDTTGLDLEGSLALELNDTETLVFNVTATDEFWMTLKFHFPDHFDADEVFIETFNGGTAGTRLAYWVHESFLNGGNLLACNGAGCSAGTTAALADDISYWLKFHFKKGTGNNAISGVYYWDGSDWDDVQQQTTGTETLQADTIRFIDNQDGPAEDHYFDNIRAQSVAADPFPYTPT